MKRRTVLVGFVTMVALTASLLAVSARNADKAGANVSTSSSPADGSLSGLSAVRAIPPAALPAGLAALVQKASEGAVSASGSDTNAARNLGTFPLGEIYVLPGSSHLCLAIQSDVSQTYACVADITPERPISFETSDAAGGLTVFGLASDDVRAVTVDLVGGQQNKATLQGNFYSWRTPDTLGVEAIKAVDATMANGDVVAFNPNAPA